MKGKRWKRLIDKVEAEIQPILAQAGYVLKLAESVRGNGGFVMMYEKDASKRISIDVLPWISFDAGQRKDFNWLRVRVGMQSLKELIGQGLATDMFLHHGWTYVSDQELNQVIGEMAETFKIYLNNAA